MIAKQQLENAARAMGFELWGGYRTDECYPTYPTYCKTREGEVAIAIKKTDDDFIAWRPLSPTTQGKADLMDLMLALDIAHHKDYGSMYAHWTGESPTGQCLSFTRSVEVINGDNQAALAEAVVSVASQIWESKQ